MAESGRRINAATRVATAIPGILPASAGGIARFLGGLNIWFWTIVGLPTLVAGVYYFGIASDLYVSEAQFVVRGPHQPTVAAGSLAAMFAGGGDEAGGDAATVKAFIVSRDAVRDLEEHDHLRSVFTRPEGDFLTRFPGFEFWRRDFEALFKAYQRFVTVDIDSETGIATLEVKAYRPEDAQRIATALVKYSEQLVNDLNARAREDTLSTYESAVQVAEQNISHVQDQLTAYRVKEQMLDPKSASSAPLVLVGGLEKDLADTRGQLAEMMRNSPRSPAIPLLQTRIASLQKLISDERSTITGDNNSVATKSAEYERLDVQRELGEKTLASAFASLEAAKLQVQQHQMYVEEIAQPNMPDYPLFPKRLSSFALVVASCFLAYGIAWLLVTGVREHASA